MREEDCILPYISKEVFTELVLPIIERTYSRRGRRPKISHYEVLSTVLYVLYTGIPWRDLPRYFGNWHSIYMRFNRGNKRGLWWKIISTLQGEDKIRLNVNVHHDGRVQPCHKKRAVYPRIRMP